MLDTAAILKAARGLFDVPLGVGLTDPAAVQPPLYPVEEQALTGAIPARRREFAAGRAAARLALLDAGHPAQAIPVQDNRAPVWPRKIVGSITHSRQLCLAVVSGEAQALGVDAEIVQAMDEDMVSTICSEREISQESVLSRDRLALTIFCAKEAAYKAQFPLTGALFGFEVLDVSVYPDAGCFDARFTRTVGPFAVGDSLPGRFAEVAGHLVTGVAIGQRDAEGA
ncbi:4'-phosphopantetheinyl transferase Npt [Sulfitobacter sp. THAF37]|uniref:4'-phosphopantetheinyl transferase family protein n=1 Tax=Sulfitobacter sp. THAF37 TaxID=2587855 RepID=UPI0012697779|nr:4'-phosphopantetheinyl transferase superfamily protein [Sulfitobacter sp. THAF37]QFT60478.1 4'-phosphopantetheinyl transferase Npt [Sulfitobacter sp. THAF37]